MRINRLELYYVVFPLIYPWRTAYGADPDVHTILVKLISGEHSGWGETTPLYAPCYSPESSVGVYQVIREYLAPQVVGPGFPDRPGLAGPAQTLQGKPFRQGRNRNRLVDAQGQSWTGFLFTSFSAGPVWSWTPASPTASRKTWTCSWRRSRKGSTPGTNAPN